MYECMCGRPPFADVQGMRILWAHLQDEPPDPASLRSDLPPSFARTLMVAMAKDPQQRPATAGEYARMLDEAAKSGPPASARRPRQRQATANSSCSPCTPLK